MRSVDAQPTDPNPFGGGDPSLTIPSRPRPSTILIRNVRVEGTRTSTPSAVIAYSGIRIGERYDPQSELLSKAIQNLYQRRLFSNVLIFAEEITDSSIGLVIQVAEYPRIDTIVFEGNDEIDDDDLEDVMTIRKGDIANPYELNLSARKIREKYAEEGYLFSTETIEQTLARDTNRTLLRVVIDEGREVSIGSINIEGNSGIEEDDLIDAMEDVQEKSWWQFWKSSKLQRDKLKDDEVRIVDYYRTKGFVEARVVRDTIVINPDNGRSDITIWVDEGPRLYLRAVRITGNSVYDSALIRRLIDVEEGEAYDQYTLETNLIGNGENSVRAFYLDNGYLTFNAEITEQRVSRDSIDAIISIEEGNPAFIRFVDIVGNTKTKDKIIRRELYTIPGQKFSRAAIIRSLRNLANLNYFNPEALNPDVRPSADATSVDIVYEVEERPSDTFNASLGLSSQGITGAIGLSFTNFSITEPFFGGGGQILNLNAEFGSYVQTYSIGVTEPWLFNKPVTVGGNLFYQKTDLSLSDNDDSKLERFGLTGTVGTRLRWPDDYFRLDGAIRFTKNNLIGRAVGTSIFRNGTEASISATLSRTSIDNPIFPTVGSRFRLPLVVAGLGLGVGDAEYIRPEIGFEFYSTLAQSDPTRSLVLMLSGDFGHLHEISPRETISPSVYYTMGGTVLSGFNTVQLRGYEDRSIGPVENNYPVGTTNFKVTAELRFPLALNPIPIYFLTFAEAGNVWGRLGDFNPFDLKRSAGVGMRVMMPPIGLLGFDYGFGFDADTFSASPTQAPISSGWHFHFQFGR